MPPIASAATVQVPMIHLNSLARIASASALYSRSSRSRISARRRLSRFRISPRSRHSSLRSPDWSNWTVMDGLYPRQLSCVIWQMRFAMSDPQSATDDLGLAGKVAIVTGGGAPHDGIRHARPPPILFAPAPATVLVAH